MIRQSLEHEIHCPAERMWALFFDDQFNVDMYVGGLGFPKCEVVEKRDDGKILHRKMECVPKADLPRALVKIIGDKTGYAEIGDWVRSAGEWRWKLNLFAFGDKVDVGGTMRLEPLPNGHCLRVTPFHVEAHVFGIKKLVEKASADNVANGWNSSAAWINGWLAKNPAKNPAKNLS